MVGSETLLPIFIADCAQSGMDTDMKSLSSPTNRSSSAGALSGQVAPQRWPWQRSLQARMVIAFGGAFLLILAGLTFWLSRIVYDTYFDAVEHDLEVAAFLTANTLEDPLSGYASEFIQYQEWKRSIELLDEKDNDKEDGDKKDKKHYKTNDSESTPTLALLPSPSSPHPALPRLQSIAETYARDLNARVTILDKNGYPVVDSHYPISLIDSQANRPEVIVAANGEEITDVRPDEFTGALTLVTAAPIQQGAQLLGIVQLSQPMQVIAEKAASLIQTIMLAGLAAVLLSTTLAIWISRQLMQPVVQLEKAALATAQGDLTQQVPVQTSDELGALAQAFNHMVDAVRTMIEQQRAFVAHASHELRTPLTNIKLRIEAVRELGDEAPDISTRYLGEIESEADRLARLANTLLDLAHLESRQSLPAETAVDLAPVLNNAASIMQLSAQKAGISLETSVPMTLLRVKVHPEEIEEVILNLLDNAIKYTPAGGRITLTASVEDRLIIRVADTGSGIPPEDLPYIFDRFYRVDKARSRTRGLQDSMGSGAGLGLSIVKQLVEQNGGCITVTSTLHQGTSFVVSLPLVA